MCRMTGVRCPASCVTRQVHAVRWARADAQLFSCAADGGCAVEPIACAHDCAEACDANRAMESCLPGYAALICPAGRLCCSTDTVTPYERHRIVDAFVHCAVQCTCNVGVLFLRGVLVSVVLLRAVLCGTSGVRWHRRPAGGSQEGPVMSAAKRSSAACARPLALRVTGRQRKTGAGRQL